MRWSSERLTGPEVCRILGITGKELRRLIGTGALSGRCEGEGGGRRYSVTKCALTFFLKRQTHEYDPAKVAGEWADFLPEEPDEWLTTAQIAELLCMTRRNVNYALRAGMVPSRRTRRGAGGGPLGDLVVRRDDVETLRRLFDEGQTPGRHRVETALCPTCRHHHPTSEFYVRSNGYGNLVCRADQLARSRRRNVKRPAAPGVIRRATEEGPMRPAPV